MINFLIASVVLLVLVLVLLFRPFYWRSKVQHASRRQLNAVIYKEELEKLEKDRASGVLDATSYEQGHAEMRQRLFQDTDEADGVSVSSSPIKTMIAVSLFISIATIGVYLWIGNADEAVNGIAHQKIAEQDVEKMVAGLAAKMEQDPTNLKGWAMLARSYKVMGRPLEAEKAYDRAGPYIDGDAQLLADYADVAASNANGSFVGKPQQLINKALKVDPNNMMALWLAGTAAFNNGDYKSAVRIWEKLEGLLPPDSEDTRTIQSSVLEAQQKGNLPIRKNPSPQPTTPLVNGSVSGLVEIDPSLKSKVNPDDVIMVIARAPGARMPLAIMRARAADLPVRFVLNDALAMTPDALISTLAEVTVEVRISKSGMAKPEPGDLLSATQNVKVGATGIKLLVNQVRP